MGRSRLPRLLAAWPLLSGGCLVTSSLDELEGAAPACAATSADCDGRRDNGCETELETTAMHCGVCGHACPSAPSAAPACVDGACTIACDIIAANCDGNDANGCETAVEKDANNCGKCGHVCGEANASASSCQSGSCAIACLPGFASCDAADANGCEADLTVASQCGSCGRGCLATDCTDGDCAGSTSLDFATALVVSGAHVYVATSQADCNGSDCVYYRMLRRIPVTGGAIEDLYEPGSAIADIAVDETGALYLATQSGLLRYEPGAPMPGPTQLISGIFPGAVKQVEVDATHAYYWLDGFGSNAGLFRVPRTGGAAESLVAPAGFSFGASSALALSDGQLYFQAHTPESLQVVPVSGGTPALVHPGKIRSMLAHAGAVYFALEGDGDTLFRHGAGTTTELVSKQDGPEALASDGTRLWWWNRDAGSLMRANLDGTAVTELFKAAAPGAALVAVDAGAVYWLAPGSGQLNRLQQ